MKRILLAIILLWASTAFATVNMTTAITMPNINRWKVEAFTDNADDAYPCIAVRVLFFANSGNKPYRTIPVVACGDTSTRIELNSASLDYWDLLKVTEGQTFVGAYTALHNAAETAGSRAARRAAVELALMNTGIISSQLSGTQ